MARKIFGLATLAVVLVFGMALTGCGNVDRNPNLVGSWDWVDGNVSAAIVLNEDGRYTWMGTDYGPLGFRWHSADGTVFARLAGTSTPWFHYQLLDNNTLRIEYAEIAIAVGVSGVFYLHRSR